MTEREWQASEDPSAMLWWLTSPASPPATRLPPRRRPSDRKLRLFACACVRQVWHLLTDGRSRKAVEVAERLADGAATVEELTAARDAAWAAAWDAARAATRDAAWAVARDAARDAARAATRAATWAAVTARAHARAATRDATKSGQAILLRDTVGNPWRHVEFRPQWRTADVMSLAHAAYDERDQETGAIDHARLAVLSDALEEAGCDDDVLVALRSPGPHCRGFWGLDLILGKE